MTLLAVAVSLSWRILKQILSKLYTHILTCVSKYFLEMCGDLGCCEAELLHVHAGARVQELSLLVLILLWYEVSLLLLM